MFGWRRMLATQLNVSFSGCRSERATQTRCVLEKRRSNWFDDKSCVFGFVGGLGRGTGREVEKALNVKTQKEKKNRMEQEREGATLGIETALLNGGVNRTLEMKMK